MTIIQTSLLLDQSAWDLVLDVNGNIALAGAPYSLAQDVASAIKTFTGECWYDNSLGVTYWQEILGHLPPLSYITQQFTTAALTIPNVQEVQVTYQSFENRVLLGQVQFIDTDGVSASVSFNG
jgi:hypothetical protein